MRICFTSVFGIAVMMLAASQPGRAGERRLIPEDAPGPPAYMRLETAGEVGITDLEWVAIPVYRYEPALQNGGIPDDFNLLLFLDNATPERAAAARSIELQVQGFTIRNPQPVAFYFENPPDAPVPVLFVRWDEFQGETEDEEIFIDELLGMESLQVGMADFYMEEINNFSTHRIATSGVVVAGELAGQEFRVTWAHGNGAQVPKVQTRITFGN